jgi:hypothetical protein
MAASYEKFNYFIRPAKQIERKLLIEGLHKLSRGFQIRDYRYVGFGSPFYADFVLFHKYLYIDDMLCIEHGPIRRRMRFNKPFPKVRLRMGEVAEIIPKLDRNRHHIVWLDYDYSLNREMLGDLTGFATTLRPESLLLITVDADPRVMEAGDLPDDILEDIREYRRQSLQREIGRYVEGGIRSGDLNRSVLPSLYAKVIVGHLRDALAFRSLQFLPMFNFSYADGHQMLSIGGMIGTAETLKKLRRTGFYNLPFVTADAEPVGISVPPLTARERLWLDQNPRSPRDKFEIGRDAVSHYRRYYRYYPNYFEALL